MRMAPRMRKGCIIFIICVSCALLQTVSAQAVTDTDCDPTANGAAVCAGEDANAECPNDGTKCECKSGYQQDKTVNTKCAKVLGGTCPTNVDCTVANSECSTSTCSCMTGYKEVTDLCKKAVTDTNCDPNADGETVCAGADANAECPNDGTKCECKSGYQQDKIDDTTCLKVLGGQCPTNIDCTIANSECSETICSCVAGYKEENNLCEKVLTEPCTANVDCTDTVENSECSSSTCSCVAGYKEDNNICGKVLTESCATNVDCTETVENSECLSLTCSCVAGYKEANNICEKVLTGDCTSNEECTETVADSECSSSSKCSCVTGYREIDNICKKAVGEDCTSTEECVTNAVCQTTCSCSPGYVETDGFCVVPSSATSTWTTTGLLVTSLFVYLPKLLNLI